MAVSRAVLLVIVVVVSQAECASIHRPEPVTQNHVEGPKIKDQSDVQETASKDVSSPVTLGKQVRLKNDEAEDPNDNSVLDLPASDAVITNSHTITSQDFAEMTGAANPQAEAANPEAAAEEIQSQENSDSPKPKKENADKPDQVEPGSEPGKNLANTNTDEAKPLGENSPSTSVDEAKPLSENSPSTNFDEAKPLDLVYSVSTSEISHEVSPNIPENVKLNDLSDGRISSSDDSDDSEQSKNLDEDVSNVSLNDLLQTISDEIKVYSNDVAMNWEGKPREAAWTIQAESALKDYVDKIGIAQSANNSNCVKKDLENHASRSKALQDARESCRSDIKREAWHKLQEETVNVLNKIKEIVQDALRLIETLSKEDQNYNIQKADYENLAKIELKKLYSKDLKDKFIKMKDDAVKGDDDEYVQCLEDRPRPEKDMTVDTLKDIMRIKNNCVG